MVSPAAPGPMVTGRVVELTPIGLRREDAARFVGLSPDTFDRWRRDGRVPAPIASSIDAAGRVRVLIWSAETLRRWLEAGMPSMDEFDDGCAGRSRPKTKREGSHGAR